MSQSYEMMYVLRPDLTEEQVDTEINKYRDFLSDRGCQDIQIQVLGRRRLAYEINNLNDGIYVQVNYQGDGTQVAPLERAMRLSDEVIRYLTIKDQKAPSATAESPTEEQPAATEA